MLIILVGLAAAAAVVIRAYTQLRRADPDRAAEVITLIKNTTGVVLAVTRSARDLTDAVSGARRPMLSSASTGNALRSSMLGSDDE